jgi:glycosyltransferase involved in cell wall biosynthesis
VAPAVHIGCVQLRQPICDQFCSPAFYGAIELLGFRETIAIACFNQAQYLADAIGSALTQTRAAHQIIVVDDGSTDATEAVARDFPTVLYHRQANAGLPAARNAGLERAKGDRILFLDADDVLTPGALQACACAFERYPDVAFVYGAYREVAADGMPLQEHSPPVFADAFAGLLTGNHIAMHGTVMYDVHRLREIGGFDESLRSCEDWDVYLRLSRRWPIAAYPEIAAEYRRHSAAMTQNSIGMLEAVHTVLDRYARAPGLTAVQKEAARTGKKYMTDFYAEAALHELWEALCDGHAVRACTVAAKATCYDSAFLGRLARAVMRLLQGSR